MGAYRRLADFSARLAEMSDIDSLFETLVDEVVALTGASKGFLVLHEQENWRIKTARNVSPESFQGTLDELSDSIISRVVETQEPIIISDALNDTVFKSSVRLFSSNSVA